MRQSMLVTVAALAVASCQTPAREDAAGTPDGVRAPAPTPVLAGSVSGGGRPLPGLFVSAEPVGIPMRTVVWSDALGRFSFSALPAGRYVVRAHGRGIGAVTSDTLTLPGTTPLTLTIAPPATDDAPTSATFLSLLPDGETKRRFILDCTGCHQFDARIATSGGATRTEQQWREAVTRMLSFAGARTAFPIISAERDADSTAAWLARHVVAGRAVQATDTIRPEARRAVLTEYDYPVPQDLPHDLAVDGEGRVVITGMFTHRMWRLDPATGLYEQIAIPVEQSNPRAVDIDSSGAWWVVLGNPQQLARRDGTTGEWTTYRIGMYPHSLALAGNGRVWFNGHFTKEPELLGYVDAATGAVRTAEIPSTPALRAGAGPIPYEIRASPDGTIWMTELHGNRIVSYAAARAAWDTLTLPTPHSGPRRMDVDARNVLWIPGYSANTLVRFDPGTRRFTEFRFPVPDALPYVVRVDIARGTIWGGTAAADALFRFDPATERFTIYPLPTAGAIIRHIAVDARSGDLWAAYGASPGVPPKIVRLRADYSAAPSTPANR